MFVRLQSHSDVRISESGTGMRREASGRGPLTCLKKEIALPSRAGSGGLDFNAYDVMAPRKPGATPATAKNGARVKHNNVPPEGVYLPNNNRLAPHMRSPEYVQMSTAAAITLGVMPGKMH